MLDSKIYKDKNTILPKKHNEKLLFFLCDKNAFYSFEHDVIFINNF